MFKQFDSMRFVIGKVNQLTNIWFGLIHSGDRYSYRILGELFSQLHNARRECR